MTVIVLGELTRDGEPAPPAPVRLHPRLFRRIAVLVIAVLTVLGATGSTPSVRHTLRSVWSIDYGEGDSMAVDDTTLYAGRNEDGNATLTAFDLATGRRRWSVPTGDETVSLRSTLGGVLVMPEAVSDARIPQGNGTFLVQTFTSSTIARDAATGRALWTLPGDALGIYPDSVLMGQADRNGNLTVLRVVGLRDGVPRWTRQLRDIDVWGIGERSGKPAGILLGDRSGLLTLVDYADGSTLHTGRVDAPWRRNPDNGVYGGVQVIGDRLIVEQAGEQANLSAVYRLDDFRELWRSDGFVIDCGTVLCTISDSGLTGHDPDTGRQLWYRYDLNGVWPVGHGRFLGNGPSSQGPYQLLDTRTGRGIGDTVRGEPTWTGGTPSGSVLLVGIVAGDYRRSTVIQLDLDTGRSYLLGAVEESAHFGCLNAPGHLVCAHPDGLEVTAVG
jgi:outer membrane protein assembly factor BamB